MDSETITHHARLLWDGAASDAARLALIKELESCAALRVDALVPRGASAIPPLWHLRQWEAKSVPGPIATFIAAMKERRING